MQFMLLLFMFLLENSVLIKNCLPRNLSGFQVVSLPARIDPLHTSAVVSLHGRLFVRVPFEQGSI